VVDYYTQRPDKPNFGLPNKTSRGYPEDRNIAIEAARAEGWLDPGERRVCQQNTEDQERIC